MTEGLTVRSVYSTSPEDPAAPGGREFLEEHGKRAPIKRAGRPEEILEVISFFASERESFIVGSLVMADGDMSIIIP